MHSLPERAVLVSSKSEETVCAFGPASLSNLGPGFDTLGLCLEGIGDVVMARRIEEPGIEIQFTENPYGRGITVDPRKNTAGVAAQLVVDRLGYEGGVLLEITKGFKPGSGIGSSAASAVAAAFATSLLLGDAYSKDELIEAVLGGESIASGARHGDNVLPALLGGLVLVSSANPTLYRKIEIPDNLWLAIILPEVQVLTREARSMLPANVGLRAAVNQASALAFMTDAFRAGDWDAVGHWMMQDNIAEPVRSTLVPCYDQIKAAAIEAGAYGCALSGSGPAMFAISDDETKAEIILQAMQDACWEAGVEASMYISRVNGEGVCSVASPDFRGAR